MALRLVASFERRAATSPASRTCSPTWRRCTSTCCADVPTAARVAVLWNPTNLRLACGASGNDRPRVRLAAADGAPAARGRLESAFGRSPTAAPETRLLRRDPVILMQRERVAEFALRRKLPTLFGWSES